MNYKDVKEENFAAIKKERKLGFLVLLLICIIAVECIVIGVMWVSNYRYKVMYDEALETQILMQEEINSLRQNPADDNTSEENPQNDEQSGSERQSDIPIVSGN